ncbi:MAG: YcaO-like family protein [Acetobacteraceae bacterium]|nr:YcaO-like family protein [Acetobacteraceae bacterium]
MPAGYFERQMRAAQAHGEEARAARCMADWIGRDAATLRGWLGDTVFAERRRVRFSDLPTVAPETVATSQARLAVLAERLGAAGLDILWVDCSPPGGEVRVVKAIVPGLECETMSYGRIGWRGVRRLRERGDALVLDAPRPGAAPVRLRPEDEARAGGPAWFDPEAADRIVGELYPLYREPGPFAAQLLLEAAHV